MPRRSPWRGPPGTGVRVSNRRSRAPTRKTSALVPPLLIQAHMKGPYFRLVGLEELGAPTKKHQSAVVKHPDAGAEQQRFPHIMGDEQSCLTEFIAQVEELLLQFHTSHRIKRTEGLIQQQHRRICRKRTRDTHPLALTAGQLAGIAHGELRRRKPDLSQQRLDTRVNVAERPTLQPWNQSNIGGHSEMRKEACILNDVSNPTPEPDQVPCGGGDTLD